MALTPRKFVVRHDDGTEDVLSIHGLTLPPEQMRGMHFALAATQRDLNGMIVNGAAFTVRHELCPSCELPRFDRNAEVSRLINGPVGMSLDAADEAVPAACTCARNA